MNTDEIQHILGQKEASKGVKLKFTHAINGQTGKMAGPAFGPDDYENVRHITGHLYYAWDDDSKTGTVYLGNVDASLL